MVSAYVSPHWTPQGINLNKKHSGDLNLTSFWLLQLHQKEWILIKLNKGRNTGIRTDSNMQCETIWRLGGILSPAGLKTMTVINARNTIWERTGGKRIVLLFFHTHSYGIRMQQHCSTRVQGIKVYLKHKKMFFFSFHKRSKKVQFSSLASTFVYCC